MHRTHKLQNAKVKLSLLISSNLTINFFLDHSTTVFIICIFSLRKLEGIYNKEIFID